MRGEYACDVFHVRQNVGYYGSVVWSEGDLGREGGGRTSRMGYIGHFGDSPSQPLVVRCTGTSPSPSAALAGRGIGEATVQALGRARSPAAAPHDGKRRTVTQNNRPPPE